MNKLTKVGLSALCGSLVSVSAAHAGDLTVTGGADMTWISKGEDMTGNPIGIGSNFTLKGSGELENGWTYDLAIAMKNAGAYSATNLGLTMGGLGSLSINQGDSANGIAAVDDKMPTAWEETWGAGLSTGVRLAVGAGGSQNIMYTTPTILGTTLTLTHAPQYGVTDQADKTTSSNNSDYNDAYDATININPSLGTEILSGLNLFAGASTMEKQRGGAGGNDLYEGVAGATYDIGPLSLGVQWSGDYTGVDDTYESAHVTKTNFYKNVAFGVAFNINDDLSVSYGEWQARKSGKTASTHNEVNAPDRTIVVTSTQAAYTMGGASIRVANIKAENTYWGTNAGDDKKATTISLGLAF